MASADRAGSFLLGLRSGCEGFSRVFIKENPLLQSVSFSLSEKLFLCLEYQLAKLPFAQPFSSSFSGGSGRAWGTTGGARCRVDRGRSARRGCRQTPRENVDGARGTHSGGTFGSSLCWGGVWHLAPHGDVLMKKMKEICPLRDPILGHNGHKRHLNVPHEPLKRRRPGKLPSSIGTSSGAHA